MLRLHAPPFGPSEPETRPSGDGRPEWRELTRGSVTLGLLGRARLADHEATPEQLLELHADEGPPAWDRCRGPFTIEVIDRENGSLTLYQDDFGHRPIYYRSDAAGLRWGDDLAAVADGIAHRRVHPEALSEALNWRWCLGRSTLVDGVRQLQPGAAIRFAAGESEPRTVHESLAPPWGGTEDQPLEAWVDELLPRLRRAVEIELTGSERPAVLLSGGVDSALLLAVTREVRPDVVAVTPTLREHADPELPRARQVATHLGAEHRVLDLDTAAFAAGAKEFAPLTGMLPRDLWAVTLLAAVRDPRFDFDTVVHGQAADTLLSGGWWDTTMREARIARRLHRWLPAPLRRGIAAGLPLDRTHLGDLRYLMETDPHTVLTGRNTVSLDRRIRHRHREWFGPGSLPASFHDRYWRNGGDPYQNLRRMGLHRTQRINLSELQTIADRAGIRWAYPFLHEPLFELARRLPDHRRADEQGRPKPIAREAFARFYPREWAFLPKLGFVTPGRALVRGGLREWVDDLTGPGSVAERCLGPTRDALTVERDYQLLWTLSAAEHFRRAFGLGLPEAPPYPQGRRNGNRSGVGA